MFVHTNKAAFLGQNSLFFQLFQRTECVKRGIDHTLLVAEGCTSNNGTKSTPCLCADLLGDWREEVVLRTTDNRELRIYSTPIPTAHRGYTLMHDPVYRLSIAWQNSAYNQPPYVGFYLGAETKAWPRPDIRLVGSR